jgi:hypothetical protein
MNTTTTTDTTTSTTTSATLPKEPVASTTSNHIETDYESLYKMIINLTSTTTTTLTTTTTTLKTLPMPAYIKLQPNWTECNKSRDCVIVSDCCGIEYGRKYAINGATEGEFDHFMVNWCMAKSHRMGCGWSMPKVSMTVCENYTCKLSYGSLYADNLTDSGFNYTYDWVNNNKLLNTTINDGLVPGEGYHERNVLPENTTTTTTLYFVSNVVKLNNCFDTCINAFQADYKANYTQHKEEYNKCRDKCITDWPL